MNLQPLVSVGLPFYNNERTLPDAIRSVFAQTLANWELIMVDDGSSDGSLGFAQSVEDARVRVSIWQGWMPTIYCIRRGSRNRSHTWRTIRRPTWLTPACT